MKRFSFFYVILLGTLFYSCQSTSLVPIDYLIPANISFPTQVKRVAIVNNTSEIPGRAKENSTADSLLFKHTNGFLEDYILNGNPQIVTEVIAQSIAEANYFNEVIICDSALQVSGQPKLSPTLSREETTQLIKALDVDMLIALEEIPITVQKKVFPVSERDFLGTADVKVYPKVSLYIANRKMPLVMINGNDSIFWESVASTPRDARRKLISDEQLIEEASNFAGSIPVKYMIPNWKSVNRFLFANGSSQMRDAAYLAQTEEWSKALPLWEKAYEASKGKKKAKAASNISLYYEMNDELEKAVEWGEKALELIKTAYGIQGEINFSTIREMDLAQIYYNLFDLKERAANFSKLKAQMDRFNDDF